jgi:hypothetical protein
MKLLILLVCFIICGAINILENPRSFETVTSIKNIQARLVTPVKSDKDREKPRIEKLSAFNGDDCATGMIRFGGMCLEID